MAPEEVGAEVETGVAWQGGKERRERSREGDMRTNETDHDQMTRFLAVVCKSLASLLCVCFLHQHIYIVQHSIVDLFRILQLLDRSQANNAHAHTHTHNTHNTHNTHMREREDILRGD